jgi:DNA-directed RNA polymerase subunit L
MPRRVFLSFVQEDLDLVNLFRGQAKNKNTDLEFADYSVQEPYDSTNATYIRSRIRERISAASVTICLIGEDTFRSRWVD